MASTPKTLRELGRDRARDLMDLNNSVKGGKSDQLFSLLEGGEGTLYLRDRIDYFLNQRMAHAGAAAEREKLRDKENLSVKDKIAYATGVIFDPGNTAVPVGAVVPFDDDVLQSRLNETIEFLQDKLISKQEFTESWIMRNAALSRFECKLTSTERGDLKSIANKIKEMAKKNNLETLVEANDFTNESDAQQIMKLTENMGQISSRGITIDEDILKKVDALEKKIQPIKDLDKRYKHLINMINMTSDMGKKYSKSMISVGDQERLTKILSERGKKPEEFIIDTQGKQENNFELLEQKLSNLKNDSKYDELIKKYKLTQNQFDERFLIYFTYHNVKNAKIQLNEQKIKTFGNRASDYQQDVNKRRGGVRERIFKIAGRMTGTGNAKVFANDQDAETINSYFDKFQNIFFANERDSYDRDGVPHFQAIRDVLAAMFRRRNPAIVNGPHGRYGSMPRKIKKWFERFFKGKEEKGIFKMIKKRWHHCDHAEILAMVVMLQNQTDQEMFHGTTDPFQKKDARYSRIFRGMRLAADGRKKLSENISPYTNKFMRAVEVSVKTVVGKPLVAGGQAYTNALKKYHRAKTPFYALYPAAWLAAQGGKAYGGVKKYLGEIQGKQVNYLYETVADTVDSVTELGAKGVSKAGNAMYNQYKTNQQRSVLDSFFAAASEDEHRKEVLQSSDLANMFSTKHRETYLFDEDGRTQTIDKIEKGEKTPEGSSVKFADKLEDQIEKLIEQASNDIRDKKAAQKTADAGNDVNAKETARLNVAHAGEVKNIVNSFQSDISKLIPILKKSIAGTPPERRYDDIRDNLGKLISLKKIAATPATAHMQAIAARNATTGWLSKKIAKLKTGNPILEGDIRTARTTVNAEKGKETSAEILVKGLSSQKNLPIADVNRLSAAQADFLAAQSARLAAEDVVNQKQIELNNAKDQLTRLEKVEETLKKVADINHRMYLARMSLPTSGIDSKTKPIAEEFNQLTKYMDILRYPEEKALKMVDITKVTKSDLEAELSRRADAA